MSNYEDEYQKWVSSLSPKERAKLVAQGLDKPLMDDYKLSTPDSLVINRSVSLKDGFKKK